MLFAGPRCLYSRVSGSGRCDVIGTDPVRGAGITPGGGNPINQDHQRNDSSPSYLFYNLVFLLFTLAVLLAPQTATGLVRQFFSSLLEPVSSSAEVRTPASRNSERKGGTGTESGQRELRAKLIESRLEIMNLRNVLNMREELRRLDVNSRPHIYLTRILSLGETNPWRRSLLIDRGHGNAGSKPPVVKGLAVTYGRQLIGRIQEVGRRTSRVQLLTDPSFTMRVIVLPPQAELPSGEEEYNRPKEFLSRRTGVIEGNGSRKMDLNHILASVSVKPDWEVISAGGLDAPIPRGLLLGRVKDVSDEYGQFLKINVLPSVNIQKIRNLMILRPRGIANTPVEQE